MSTRQRTQGTVGRPRASSLGVDARDLDDTTLLHYLRNLHRTRADTLQHGSIHALVTHLTRTGELEVEYLARRPMREVGRPRPR